MDEESRLGKVKRPDNEEKICTKNTNPYAIIIHIMNICTLFKGAKKEWIIKQE